MPPIIVPQPLRPSTGDGGPQWIPLNGFSECFVEVRFWRKSKYKLFSSNKLEVRFLKYGEVWEYSNISESLWTSFINSQSKGRFYNFQIKGKYPSRRRGFVV